jgi:hypothetical protein
MGKFFFPALGVGFSDLRQIALTFCHRIVIGLAGKNWPFFDHPAVVLGP